MICRKAILRFPIPIPRLLEHKNSDFVLGKPENGGVRGQKRTKTSILCSKSPKTGVPKGKSAQKPRFCAREARKRGFQRQKAHKNPDFVLEKPENEGFGGQKRTKTSILCPGKPEYLTSGLVLVLLLMLIIDMLDVAIFCIDWIYNNCYFILHCQR